MRPEDPDRDRGTPLLGSWPRTYLLVAVLAVVMMFLLWSLTAAFNIRLGKE
jgi:hypothetical protein